MSAAQAADLWTARIAMVIGWVIIAVLLWTIRRAWKTTHRWQGIARDYRALADRYRGELLARADADRAIRESRETRLKTYGPRRGLGPIGAPPMPGATVELPILPAPRRADDAAVRDARD